MKHLVLVLSIFVASNVAAEEQELNKGAAFAYGGTAHLMTELSIKTMNAVMNENGPCTGYCSNSNPTTWNHLFSSILVFSILANTEAAQDHTSEQKTINTIGIAAGVITGNIFQIEW